MDDETLLLPQNFPVSIYSKLCDILNTNNSWEAVARYFTFFNEDAFPSIRHKSNPAEYVLSELGIRLCNLGMLCFVLEKCKLYKALLLFKEHEPLYIVEQPYVSGDNNSRFIFRGQHFHLYCSAVGFPPPKYQWVLNDTIIPNAVDENFVIEHFSVEDEGCYYCRVYQEGFEFLNSHAVHVALVPELPVITQQPIPQLACRPGSSAIIKIEATGHPKLSYQWYRHTEQLDGAESSELTLAAITEKNEGSYRCCVKNSAGELWSEKCELTVYRSPEDLTSLESRPVATAKVALLIGNQDYVHMAKLSTPECDVKTLAEIFKNHGFSVLALQNLTLKEMKTSIREFCKILPKGAYVVFYFAGHGFEHGDKYMMPIDIPENYLTYHALSEGEFLRDVLDTSPQMLLELLDMCLKSPDENRAIQEEKAKLHKYRANNNLIQGYATSSYQAAYERQTDVNGLFVKLLQKYLVQDTLIMWILRNVARDMEKEYPEQKPYRGTDVTKEFCLTDPCEDNQQVKMQVDELMNVSDIQAIQLKNGDEVKIHCFPYLGVFCNTLQVCFANIPQYKVSSYVEPSKLKIERLGEDVMVTVKNIQRLGPNDILELDFEHRATNEVERVKWPLGKPLIRISDSWSDSDDSIEKLKNVHVC